MTTALITGANRGIGLEFCKQLKAKGFDVIAACRKSSPELDALGVRVETGVDVADDAAVKKLADKLDGVTIDWLILNAGILSSESLDDLDLDRIRKQFEVNAVGPLRVTKALLPKLKKGTKIALITSRMGSIADNGSGGMYGYRMSKAALNAAGKSLAIDLKDRGIAVAILHPGFVRTDMTGGNGNIDPDESARNLIERIEELTMQTSGTFRHSNGDELPW